MSSCQRVARPITRSLRQTPTFHTSSFTLSRTFTQSAARRDEVTTATTTAPSAEPIPSPLSSTSEAQAPAQDVRDTVTNYWAERKLVKQGLPPIGSRRRRAAIKTSQNIPFEHLPYQCFQEARQILQEDRQEKLQALQSTLASIKRLEETPADQLPGGERKKNMRLTSLREHVEELKILADINDPVVKRKFEDGLGDFNKPVYRHLAEKKWRGYPFRLLQQRIETLNIVPDVLPKFEPTVDVQMFFRRNKIEPGEILDSRVTEIPPRLKVQVFDAGERLVSVVVMDSDVPNAETDSFERRCHYLAANIPISPNTQSLPLALVKKDTELAVPWLPAFSQKGAPYHRLSVFVLEQKPGQTLDLAKLKELYSGRDGFSLKSYRDKFGLKPVGFNIFRTVWDEGTAGVMKRHNIPGADVEFKLKRVYSMKGEKKLRGWEVKRQKPKYKSLWKYTHRVRGVPRYKGRRHD
ncbi:putative 54S ribosomal protein L35 [Seiridium cardinale]|uniref:54S ribosomal protein L35 n=1 Tax=Seiridium cardinale TaxID=138064 RepID=A0ABR2XK35_9PEZI